jgi:hypothetical protein
MVVYLDGVAGTGVVAVEGGGNGSNREPATALAGGGGGAFVRGTRAPSTGALIPVVTGVVIPRGRGVDAEPGLAGGAAGLGGVAGGTDLLSATKSKNMALLMCAIPLPGICLDSTEYHAMSLGYWSVHVLTSPRTVATWILGCVGQRGSRKTWYSAAPGRASQLSTTCSPDVYSTDLSVIRGRAAGGTKAFPTHWPAPAAAPCAAAALDTSPDRLANRKKLTTKIERLVNTATPK